MAHQIDRLDLVTRLNRERGRPVVLVLHDRRHRRADLMTEEMIASVFDIRCRVIDDPVHERPLCIPLRDASPRFAVPR